MIKLSRIGFVIPAAKTTDERNVDLPKGHFNLALTIEVRNKRLTL